MWREYAKFIYSNLEKEFNTRRETTHIRMHCSTQVTYYVTIYVSHICDVDLCYTRTLPCFSWFIGIYACVDASIASSSFGFQTLPCKRLIFITHHLSFFHHHIYTFKSRWTIFELYGQYLKIKNGESCAVSQSVYYIVKRGSYFRG